ncbi:hypothetical protein HYX08_01640 [Candidatus Woesearchaeota archaeon]|nr:hypothetical protein [Candidatus Woesearchaeota archaeon]
MKTQKTKFLGNKKLLRLLVILLIIFLVLNIVFLALKIINEFFFWILIIAIAVFAYFWLPKLNIKKK